MLHQKLVLTCQTYRGIDGQMKLGVVAGAYVEVFVTKNIGIDVEMGYSRQGSSGVYNTAYTTDALGNVTTSRVGPYDYRLDYINIDYLAPLVSLGRPHMEFYHRFTHGTSSQCP